MTKTKSYREHFPHRKLEVYHVASAFYVACWKFAARVRFPDYFMRSQFLRAALSIKLNIAEGAGEWRKAEKARISASRVVLLMSVRPCWMIFPKR